MSNYTRTENGRTSAMRRGGSDRPPARMRTVGATVLPGAVYCCSASFIVCRIFARW